MDLQIRHRIAIFALILAPIAGATVVAAETAEVSLSEMSPMQMDAGFAHSKVKEDKWVAEAKSLSDKTGEPFKEVLTRLINMSGGKGIAAYIDPDGRIRPDDSHHKILAAENLIEKYDLDASKIRWKVNIEADFKGKSWEEFGTEMDRRGIGYFPPDILAESQRLGESLGSRYRRLPKLFKRMRDSPIRSAIGTFYDAQGLEGSWFRPYSQFYVAEDLLKRGFYINPMNPDVQTQLNELYFGPGGEEWRKSLLFEARPEFRSMIQEKIETARAAYQKSRSLMIECIEKNFQLSENPASKE